MQIRTYPHEDFNVMCYQRKLDDSNVESVNDTEAFISIIGTKECRKYYLEDETGHWFIDEHSNVLNLEFDDVTDDLVWHGHLFKAMNEEQADKCIDFIEKNKGKNIYVHCKAGISRSGAVSQFIFDFYNKDNIYNESDFEYFNRHIRPNNHVLTLLKRAYYKKYGLFVDENKDF